MGMLSRKSRSEGVMTRAIESQTSKLPSGAFLWAAMGSIAGSMFLQARGKRERSLFIGQWAPTFLLLGLYNKFVKEMRR